MVKNITVGLVEHHNQIVTARRGVPPRDVPAVLEMLQGAGSYVVKINAGHIVSVQRVGDDVLNAATCDDDMESGELPEYGFNDGEERCNYEDDDTEPATSPKTTQKAPEPKKATKTTTAQKKPRGRPKKAS